MKRLTVPALLAAIFAVLLWATMTGVLNSYWQSVIMFMGVNVILATSLNIINGNMGEFSCGHAGFMAIGAYGYAISTLTLGFPVWGAVLVGIGASIIFPRSATAPFPQRFASSMAASTSLA